MYKVKKRIILKWEINTERISKYIHTLYIHMHTMSEWIPKRQRSFDNVEECKGISRAYGKIFL